MFSEYVFDNHSLGLF